MNNIYNISSTKPFIKTLIAGILKRFNGPDFSNLTIFLPSRRSLREFNLEFSNISYNIKMPKLLAIGDLSIEEEEENIEGAISVPELKFILANLIREYGSNIFAGTVTAADAAENMISFLYELRKNQVDFAKLDQIEVLNSSIYWQKNLEFLQIITKKLPEILSSLGKTDPIDYLNKMIENFCSNLPKGPIIIAGSTGSILITRKLMQCVLNHPNSSIIVPGFDYFMDEEYWDNINRTHPSYHLKNLFLFLNYDRKNVTEWHGEIEEKEKLQIASEIMRPANTTYHWNNLNISKPSHISLIECENLSEEAKTISLIARDVIEEDHKTCVIVTSDVRLIKFIHAHLLHFDIDIDFSNVIGLSSTKIARYFYLIAKMLLSNYDPIDLLAFLKIYGYDQETITKLELQARSLFGIEEVEFLKEKCARLHKIFSYKTINFQDALREHLALLNELEPLENFIATEKEQFFPFIEELINHAHFDKIKPSEYLGLLDKLLLGQKYHEDNYFKHPRVAILSPIESRIIDADLVIVPMFNEDSWPRKNKKDQFTNEEIRGLLGMESKEAEIAKSAHDLYCLLGSKQIIFTRSKKLQGSTTIESRYLMRMKTIFGDLKCKTPYLEWAKIKPESVFQPKVDVIPPLEARPQRISVTDIQKLIQNPYTVFVEKILNLKKLDPINPNFSSLDFGNLVHDTLDKYNKTNLSLTNIGEKLLGNLISRDEVKNIFWPRFLNLSHWIENNITRGAISELKVSYKISEVEIVAKIDRLDNDTIIDFKTGNLPTQKEIANFLAPQLGIEAIILEHNNYGENFNLQYIQLKNDPLILSVNNPEEIINAYKIRLQELLEYFYSNPNSNYNYNEDSDKCKIYAQLARASLS